MTIEEAIKQRHSVRKYIHKPLSTEVVRALEEKIGECNKEGGLHIQLVTQETKAFSGIMSYGKFHGVENYFVMAGQKADDLDERIGYYGEQLVLLAQALGLNTCWAGLSYRKVNEAYKIEKGEKLTCMIALGYGESQGISHKIKTMEQVSNATSNSPSWFRKGVEAALLAPTAINQQKFSFFLQDQEGTKAGCKPKVLAKRGFSMVGYTKMDLGIAKLHFEIGAGNDFANFCISTGLLVVMKSTFISMSFLVTSSSSGVHPFTFKPSS